ncbi:MAG: PKD domain-containing protein [Candidatus Aminicenantia bacterium]
MRKKKLIFLITILLVVSFLNALAGTHVIRKLGKYPFCRCRGGIPTGEVMKEIVKTYAEDVKYGFDMAGYGDVYLPFLDQLETGTFEEATLPVGEKLMWMLYRVRGRVKVLEDVEWGGKEPLEAFSFKVIKEGRSYEFIMPKPCGNISLYKITEVVPFCAITVSPSKANIGYPITVDVCGSENAATVEVNILDEAGNKIETKVLETASCKWETSFDKPGKYTFQAVAISPLEIRSTNPCQAEVVINAPPFCQITVTPEEAYLKKPFTFDASGSSDPDGRVTSVTMVITDEAGNEVDRKVIDGPPFVWEKTFDQPGIYRVSATVTDDFGAVSVNECFGTFTVKRKILGFIIDAGWLRVKSCVGDYLFGRGGLLFHLVQDKLDAALMLGGGIPIAQQPEDAFKSIFVIDGLLNYYAGPFTLGGGLGVSSPVKKSGWEDNYHVEFLLDTGFNFYQKDEIKAGLFAEGRFALDKLDDISGYHKYWIGLRVTF